MDKDIRKKINELERDVVIFYNRRLVLEGFLETVKGNLNIVNYSFENSISYRISVLVEMLNCGKISSEEYVEESKKVLNGTIDSTIVANYQDEFTTFMDEELYKLGSFPLSQRQEKLSDKQER